MQKKTNKYGKAAVILVNWNTESFIDSCIASLIRQTYQDFDIIFVDNGSQGNGYAETKAKWKPKLASRLTMLKSGKPLGFAGGHNLGITHALGSENYSSVVLLNLDTTVDKNWLEELLKTLFTDKKTGVVSSILYLYEKFKIFEITARSNMTIERVKTDSDYMQLVYFQPEENLKLKINKAFTPSEDLSKGIKKQDYVNGQELLLPFQLKEGKTYRFAIPFKDKSEKIKLYTKSKSVRTEEINNETNIFQNCGIIKAKSTQTYIDQCFFQPEFNVNLDSIKTPDASSGCSIALKIEALKKVGLLDEKLFSYFEDIDISERFKKAGYKIKLAKKAMTFHYFSGATRNNTSLETKIKGTSFREFYGVRNRLVIMKRYWSFLDYIKANIRILADIAISLPRTRDKVIRAKIWAKFQGIAQAIFFT